jgi:phage pi2 protein 07
MSLLQINEEEVRRQQKEIIRELLEEDGQIGSLWKMDRMRIECGGKSAQWVREHVCYHPHVVRNQLAFNSGTDWVFKAKEIIKFLDMYFPDLAINWKNKKELGGC